jgi:hypothetical protein
LLSSNLPTFNQRRANEASGLVAELFDHGLGANQDVGVNAMTREISPALRRQREQLVSRRAIGYDDQDVEVTVGLS